MSTLRKQHAPKFTVLYQFFVNSETAAEASLKKNGLLFERSFCTKTVLESQIENKEENALEIFTRRGF